MCISLMICSNHLHKTLCNNYATHAVDYTQYLEESLTIVLHTNHNGHLVEDNGINCGNSRIGEPKKCQDLLHALEFLMAYQPLRLYMALSAES